MMKRRHFNHFLFCSGSVGSLMSSVRNLSSSRTSKYADTLFHHCFQSFSPFKTGREGRSSLPSVSMSTKSVSSVAGVLPVLAILAVKGQICSQAVSNLCQRGKQDGRTRVLIQLW